jgi:hypothetical protein
MVAGLCWTGLILTIMRLTEPEQICTAPLVGSGNAPATVCLTRTLTVKRNKVTGSGASQSAVTSIEDAYAALRTKQGLSLAWSAFHSGVPRSQTVVAKAFCKSGIFPAAETAGKDRRASMRGKAVCHRLHPNRWDHSGREDRAPIGTSTTP